MTRSTHTKRYKIFCRLLVEARQEKELTQAQVAKKLGKPQSYVSKYESGERRVDVVEFLEIMKVLNLNPKEIFEGL